MTIDQAALETLIAKDAIRELALLYSRGVDRKDGPLLRSLYTADATDHHGPIFTGPADAYVDFLERSFPYLVYSGHHVCNHLISVNGDEGEGEVYAIALHLIPDGKGGTIEDLLCVRYVDTYRREADGRWRFAKRVVEFDMRRQNPVATPEPGKPVEADASVTELASRLFARGTRG